MTPFDIIRNQKDTQIADLNELIENQAEKISDLEQLIAEYEEEADSLRLQT